MNKYYRLFVFILLLAVVAGWVVYKNPIKKGLDIAGGMRVVLEADKTSADWPKTDVQAQRSLMEKARNTIESRIGGIQGVSEGKAFLSGNDKIVVEIPGVKDTDEALNTIKNTAQLEFYYLKDLQTQQNPGGKWTMTPSANNEYFFTDGTNDLSSVKDKQKVMDLVVNSASNPPILTGKYLLPTASQNIANNQAVVNIQFNKEGKEIFREFTKKHQQETLAIFLNKELLTAPTIQAVIIDGQAQISGFKGLDEAKNLAAMLNSGALPVSFNDVSRDTVEPTIGGGAFSQVLKAGLIGLLLVVIFMVIVYRLPGFIASIALVLYSLFVLAIFAGIKVTMSLSGMAALIISIGMAIDANILIFERLKEELKLGKTLGAAIDAGFKRAFTAIVDSNVCTCITCFLLMQFGSPSVQSFATTLLIGTLVSMFTAITVTKNFLHLTVRFPNWQKPQFFGINPDTKHKPFHINFVGPRKIYYLISIILLVPGCFVWFTQGLNKGIEFKPGTEMSISFVDKDIKVTEISSIVKSLYPKSEVQLSTNDKNGKVAYIKVKPITTLEQDNLVKALDAKYKVANRTETGKPIVDQSASVEPTISAEITNNAFKSIIFACLAIILYLAMRFAINGALEGVKYGVCAVIALIHDALFIVGMFAILGKVLGWQIDSLFITAVLTIIGFSVHDTIVCFDRIRENLKHRLKAESFAELTNRSINQTLTRSIYTSFTVFMTILSLIIFGGSMLREFYFAMIIGIVVGTYSSIFVASQLLVDWTILSSRRKVSKGNTAVIDEGRILINAPKAETSVTADKVEDVKFVEVKTVVVESTEELGEDKSAKKKSTGRKRRF